MTKSKNIILIGGGGHCKVIIDTIRSSEELDICGIIDLNLSKGTSVLGVKVLGKDMMLHEIFNKGIKKAFISIASIGNCETRRKIYTNLKKIGFQIPIIIHPKAVVGTNVTIKEGTFVAAGAVINPGSVVGANVIINTSASVDHDCQIGDFVHIAPGVTLSGGVKIGEQTHLGTGANVIQYINIGKGCMIGAGVTVRSDMKDGQRNTASV